MPPLFLVITVMTLVVRPALAAQMVGNPIAWLGDLVFVAGAVAVFTGLRGHSETRTFAGSNLMIIGLLGAGAATIFPVMLFSTLDPVDSLTAYNTAAPLMSLELALLWWPPGLVLTCAYFWWVSGRYAGKVKLGKDSQAYY
jgi:cytochrome d ubiquinol oxidase subunit II